MTVAYARVSTHAQDSDNQLHSVKEFAAFKKLSIDKEVKETVKSIAETREIYSLVEQLQKGDTLLVAELSRLGRGLYDLISIIEELNKKDVRVFFVREMLELHKDNPAGNLQLQILGAFAEYERKLIQQRTKDTIAAKRKQRDDYFNSLCEQKKEELQRELSVEERDALFDAATLKHPVGRPKGAKSITPKIKDNSEKIKKLLKQGKSKTYIAKSFDISRVTLNKYIKEWEEDEQKSLL